MTTLKIHLQTPHECLYKLSPLTGCKLLGELTVVDVITLKRGDYSRVIRGTLRIDAAGPSSPTCKSPPRYVVLKLVRTCFHGHRLAREAENYELAKTLQGIVIPKSYGLFHGPTPDGFVTCLLLEYVGNSAPVRFASSPMDFNLSTLDKLIQLHDAGFLHGCVREEHAISPNRHCHSQYSDGGPFLISLSRLRPHRCTRSLPIVESVLRPAPHDFSCDELWTVAAQMGVWNPGEIAYFSKAVPLSSARSPEQLARAAPLRMQATAAGWEEALRQARAALEEFKSRYALDDAIEEFEYESDRIDHESNSRELLVMG